MPDANEATRSMSPHHDPEETDAATNAPAGFARASSPGHEVTSTDPKHSSE